MEYKNKTLFKYGFILTYYFFLSIIIFLYDKKPEQTSRFYLLYYSSYHGSTLFTAAGVRYVALEIRIPVLGLLA